MKIALGADSAGKPLIDVIEAHLRTRPDIAVSNLSQSGFYADPSGNVASAESYNQRDASGGMVSARGMNGFTRAINALIAGELPSSPRTAQRIAKVMFLFWTRKPVDSGVNAIFSVHRRNDSMNRSPSPVRHRSKWWYAASMSSRDSGT